MYFKYILKIIEINLTAFFNSIISLILILMLSKISKKIPKSTKEYALVLGNGPSLIKNINEINNKLNFGIYDLWVVNFYALSEGFIKTKPNYYVLADPSIWRKQPTNNIYQLINKINETLSWGMILFIPYEAKIFKFDKMFKNKNLTINFYNNTPCKGHFSILNYIFRFGLGMPKPVNVLIPSLVLCIRQKYKMIHLYGADHSWHENIESSVNGTTLVKQFHFYKENVTSLPMIKTDGTPFKIHELFYEWASAFSAYYTISEFAQYMKVNIKNCSAVSYIDAFQKNNS